MVTNIPGPQIPLYLCGAEVIDTYGYVPLVETTALGIALFSGGGRLAWGFNADYELVPDLAAFTAVVEASFRELQQSAWRASHSYRGAVAASPESRRADST